MFVEPKRNRIAERQEATRREILDTAWAIARETSIAAVTLREIADRIGMQPPSLYTHFASKNAVFDAMYQGAWEAYRDIFATARSTMPAVPRAALRVVAHTFFDFAVADLARFQLMNQRTVADFAPTDQAYAPAVEVLEMLGALLTEIGLPGQAERDLCVAIIGGLVDAQLANDPGGTRWESLLDRAVDMFADEAGLPGERTTTRPPRARGTAARRAKGEGHDRIVRTASNR
jgi:AcrR family transcriptional regulator